MILSVKCEDKIYEVSLNGISQWCGYDVKTKNRIIDILNKYFSSAKYLEYERDMSGCIAIDGEKIGRKYYKIYCISSKEDLIQYIKGAKTGLIIKYIKSVINKFDYQKELEIIDDALLKIYQILNEDIESFGKVMFDYDREELFSIIHQSEIKSSDSDYLEILSEYELATIFLNTYKKIQTIEPEKSLIIFKNIDHLIHKEKYDNFIHICDDVKMDSNTEFIISSSIDEYVYFDKILCEGITVFNDVIYRVPEYIHLKEYVENEYPIYEELDEDTFDLIMKKCINKIGKTGNITSFEDVAIYKMINKTLLIDNIIEKPVKSMVIAYIST